MKTLIGDVVAVVKQHEDTDTPFIALVGKLTEKDRGLRTEDGRAYAEEGECPPEATTDAQGWSVVVTDEGKRFSVPSKSLKLYRQAVVQQHNETMAQVAQVQSRRADEARLAVAAKARCKELGLDVDSLSYFNALLIVSKLP